VNGVEVERVSNCDLLGVKLSDDAKWSIHVSEQLKKANQGIFVLYHLKKSGAPLKCLKAYYLSKIRSNLESASPVYHYALSVDDVKRIEKVQKRAAKCMAISYSSLQSLKSRRDELAKKQFCKMMDRKDSLIPPIKESARRGQSFTPNPCSDGALQALLYSCCDL
jgi:hypothetical protein